MSIPLDESIVGQWYIPHTNAFAQCVVGDDEEPALVGTAEVCPEIFKIHSPAFSLSVRIGRPDEASFLAPLFLTKQFVYLESRKGNVYLVLFDQSQVFKDWTWAVTYRDDHWAELKYQAVISQPQPAFGQLDQAA